MKLIITATTDKDLPEDTPYDCMDAVQETLKEVGLEVKDIDFKIEG